jgi:hypothetical protein
VRGLSKLAQQHLQSALDILEHLVVPDPDNAIAKRLQFGIAFAVRWAVGMLTAINLHDQPALATKKIHIKPTDRFLPAMA